MIDDIYVSMMKPKPYKHNTINHNPQHVGDIVLLCVLYIIIISKSDIS